MGCTQARPEEHKRIEKLITEEKKGLGSKLKLLLLGAGESGKSTIAKQLKILNVGEYTKDELYFWIPHVRGNTIFAIKALVLGTEKLKLKLSEENIPRAENVKNLSLTEDDEMTDKVEDIKALWADPAIQEAYDSSHLFQLNDNAQYCLENIDRIMEHNYLPTQTDVVRCRLRTTGVVETEFNFKGVNFSLIDVGGQRAERRKWMGCFDSVTAVLFVVSLSEYNQTLAEDDSVNRMHESIALFEELTTRWFRETTIILFLNKSDLFREKLKKGIEITPAFPNYKGSLDYGPAVQYIQEQFVSRDPHEKSGKSRLYPHVTCATDTKNVKHVFDAVYDTILQANLADAGIAV